MKSMNKCKLIIIIKNNCIKIEFNIIKLYN